ncbi:GlxA family transcriptional regulator [Pseudomonas sp. NPDC090233]|uniref:GlxA family transcriptional regulator n=1 Tax=Pseudomonas sp. NPDC090233 TaxID=3364479 RepID=UPI00383B4B5E
MTQPAASHLRNRNFAHLAPDHRLATGAALRRVGFVLLEHFSMMTLTTAMDTLAAANQVSAKPLFAFTMIGDSAQVRSDSGIVISVDQTLADLDARSLDFLFVCGGFRVPLKRNPRLRRKLHEADSHGCLLGGLWNGAYFIAEAGLLDEHDCAFHVEGRAMMSELFPGVRVSRAGHVLDRRRLSCAGASSALDMMLELLAGRYGKSLLVGVEQIVAADKPAPAVPKVVPPFRVGLPQNLNEAIELMSCNIEEPIAIDEIARHVKLSRRQLERAFRQHVQSTPLTFYLELRLGHARQLLQHTDKPMSEIAIASGFTSFSYFYRRFHSFFAMPPRKYRAMSRGWAVH